jgi:hypothetical protein
MRVIRNVHDAGISVTLYVMVGFPTETEAEARETLRTLLENRRSFEEVSIRVFYLDDMSDIFRTPERFDIVDVIRDERADLQVYYDFRTGSGMSRAQARHVYLEMLAELESHLPVFRNRNVLYHELKSHYFLYLAKAGGVEKLLHDTFAPGEPEEVDVPDRPLVRGDLRVQATRFDRQEVDRALEDAQDGLTLPRYQFDLITGETAAELDRTVPPVEPCPGALLLDPRNGHVHHLSPDSLELLQACRGDAPLDTLLERYPEEDRPAAREFLRQLAQAGLLESEEVTV